MTSDDMRPVPGFTILRTLGSGGMGVVELARQESLGRQVALKRIARNSAMARPRLRALLASEARVLARLDHPNIVRVHDLADAGEEVVLVMEYVPGGTLPQVLAAGGVTRGQLIGIVLALGGALDHAHAQRVVHSDVKPRNVLVDDRGSCKLGDFGIARLAGRGATLTAAGLGTPPYQAPEQISHPERVDRRADVYSLGVVARELLTAPVRSAAVSGAWDEAPFDVLEAIHRATDPDPRRRIATAGEFCQALEAACDRAWPTWRAEAAVALRPLTAAEGETVGPGPAPRSTTALRVPGHAPGRAVRPRPSTGPVAAVLAAVIIALVGFTAFQLGVRAADASRIDPLSVTSVALSVSPAATGNCPIAVFRFDGRVVTNGAGGTIAYEWVRPDGQRTGRLRAFLRPRITESDVVLEFTYRGQPTSPVLGTAALHVVAPADVYSPPVAVTFQCGSGGT